MWILLDLNLFVSNRKSPQELLPKFLTQFLQFQHLFYRTFFLIYSKQIFNFNIGYVRKILRLYVLCNNLFIFLWIISNIGSKHGHGLLFLYSSNRIHDSTFNHWNSNWTFFYTWEPRRTLSRIELGSSRTQLRELISSRSKSLEKKIRGNKVLEMNYNPR